MARSVYVYVVHRNGEPPAAFTVRHELIAWLERHSGLWPFLAIWRCGDGLAKNPPRQITLAELGLQVPAGMQSCRFCGQGLVTDLRKRCEQCRA